ASDGLAADRLHPGRAPRVALLDPDSGPRAPDGVRIRARPLRHQAQRDPGVDDDRRGRRSARHRGVRHLVGPRAAPARRARARPRVESPGVSRVLSTAIVLALLAATAGAFVITEGAKLEKSPIAGTKVTP